MGKHKSYKIDLTNEADDDLDTIYDYICQIFSAKTAKEVIRGIEDLKGRTIRFAKFKQSRIIYEFKDDVVTIIRIVDMRQDPMNWEL